MDRYYVTRMVKTGPGIFQPRYLARTRGCRKGWVKQTSSAISYASYDDAAKVARDRYASVYPSRPECA